MISADAIDDGAARHDGGPSHFVIQRSEVIPSLRQQPRRIAREVGQHAIGAGALDAGQRFQRAGALVEPAVGGGGLGDLGIRYGYNRFNPTIMLITVVILVVMVQGFQSLGDYLVRKSDRK